MKPHRDANALAARLSTAANKPVPLPEPSPALALVTASEPAAPTQTMTPKKARAAKVVAETVAITLRPSRSLLNRYTLAAAERTRKTGRVISAQEMMIETLERSQ